MNCGVGCRCSWDPVLLWLLPAVTASIRPLAWEPPYAEGKALEKAKRQKAKKKKKKRKPDSDGTEVAFEVTKLIFKKTRTGFPIVVQQKQIQLGTMRLRVWSLASISGLRTWHCCGCGVSWQLQSDWTPSLGTSICHRCSPIKTRRQKKKERKKERKPESTRKWW